MQVADHVHRRGIGTGLVRLAARQALAGGAHTLSVYTARANAPMLGLLRRLGPASTSHAGSHTEMRLSLSDVTSHSSPTPDEDFQCPQPHRSARARP
ncbi:GNAT family N-acetyltransferase [Streptomyces sp. NPDC059456]|uniref:GNAT family N-acetyltransferase n=1 Tax=Streptomyces sp. NPDC059456 TaxID=3346838 RepID=UPI0036B07F8C